MTDAKDSLVLEDYSVVDESEELSKLNELNSSFKQNLVDRMAQQFSISILEEALKAASLRAEINQVSPENFPRSVDFDNLKLEESVESLPINPKTELKTADMPQKVEQEISNNQVVVYHPQSVFPFSQGVNFILRSDTSTSQRPQQNIASPSNNSIKPSYSKLISDSDHISQIIQTPNLEQPALHIQQIQLATIQTFPEMNTSMTESDHYYSESQINTENPAVVHKVSEDSPSSEKNTINISQEHFNQKSIQSLETLDRNSQKDNFLQMVVNPDHSIPTNHSNASQSDPTERLQYEENAVAVKSSLNQHQISEIMHPDSNSKKKRRSEEISHESPSVHPSVTKNNEREIKGHKRKSDSAKFKVSQAWDIQDSVSKNDSKHMNLLNSTGNKVFISACH